jgi:flagellar basal-body rod protein FlgG
MTTFSQLFGVSQSSLRLNMLNLDEVSHNLANINTNGFKSQRLDFQELLQNDQLSGSQLVSYQIDMTQGGLKATTKELDVAISGSGFFSIQLPDGTIGYTRDGNFQRDGSGVVVNSAGYPLIWSGSIPADAAGIAVGTDGTVSYKNTTDGNNVIAGTIPLSRFVNPSGLESRGDNIWVESAASGAAETGSPQNDGFGTLADKTLEASNVDLAEQTTNTILLQRSFQVAISALKQTDTMMGQAIRMRSA